MQPRISLCMIVRNEEVHLPDCLRSAADLVDEVIVVDTGSTDRTREIAADFGAALHDFAWVDDFSAARNESLIYATGEWIFWLDADDRIDEENRSKLRQLFGRVTKENIGYVMTYLALRVAGGADSAAEHVQLFRNHPQIRWQHRVHEQILPSIEMLGGRAERTDVIIHHLGYQEPATVAAKLERNLKLLRLEDADRPGDPFTQFNLGRTFLRLGQADEAVRPLRQAVEGLRDGNPQVLKITYALLVETHGRLNQFREALAVCQEGRGRFPNDLELLMAEGITLINLGHLQEAQMAFARILTLDPNHAGAQFYQARLRPPPQPFFQFDVGT